MNQKTKKFHQELCDKCMIQYESNACTKEEAWIEDREEK